MSDDNKPDFTNLDRLLKALKNPPSVKVGILGKSAARKNGEGNNNPTVGAAHEFGTEKLPQRSFLRMPLTTKLKPEMESNGLFDREIIEEIINKKSLVGYLSQIGATAVTVIKDAFASGGFGKWEPSNMKLKKNHQTLVETQQLRDSITWEVNNS